MLHTELWDHFTHTHYTHTRARTHTHAHMHEHSLSLSLCRLDAPTLLQLLTSMVRLCVSRAIAGGSAWSRRRNVSTWSLSACFSSLSNAFCWSYWKQQEMKWNERCFSPQFCTVMPHWVRDNLGRWDEFWNESCPRCRIDPNMCTLSNRYIVTWAIRNIGTLWHGYIVTLGHRDMDTLWLSTLWYGYIMAWSCWDLRQCTIMK